MNYKKSGNTNLSHLEKRKLKSGEETMIKYQDIDFTDSDILLNEKWDKQTDATDFDTNFIYYCKKYMQVVELAEDNEVDLVIATHRWYNFVCSKAVEEIFCELGARPESDTKNKTIDLYINNIPFDIKVSVFPANYQEKDIATRKEKNELIKWLYQNQSQEGRNHSENKIFIVCKGKTYFDSLWMKHNFEKIKTSIKKFMEYYASREMNKVQLDDGKTVYTDLIIITNK